MQCFISILIQNQLSLMIYCNLNIFIAFFLQKIENCISDSLAIFKFVLELRVISTMAQNRLILFLFLFFLLHAEARFCCACWGVCNHVDVKQGINGSNYPQKGRVQICYRLSLFSLILVQQSRGRHSTLLKGSSEVLPKEGQIVTY